MSYTDIKTAFNKRIPIDFLRKGDRFRAERVATPDGEMISLTGVAHMDGHSVSSNYGVRQGNTYWTDPDHPERNYINVHWDHIDYTHRYGRDDQYDHWPNSGLKDHGKGAWVVWVDANTYDRYLRDKATNEALVAGAEEAVVRAALDAELAEARSLLNQAQERLAAAQSKIAQGGK